MTTYIVEIAADYVEGGIYISPEFQLGQVYDCTLDAQEDIILYRPVYVCVPHTPTRVTNTNNAVTSKKNKFESIEKKEVESEKCTSV